MYTCFIATSPNIVKSFVTTKLAFYTFQLSAVSSEILLLPVRVCHTENARNVC